MWTTRAEATDRTIRNRMFRTLATVIGLVLVIGLLGWFGHRTWKRDYAQRPPLRIDQAKSGFSCDGCNLILISLDTLRADRLGYYGHDRPTSPNLDALAQRSVVFRDVLAQASTTAPSHRSIFSGHYVFEHRNDVGELPLMAELLSDAGYDTAAFVDGAQMSEDFGMSKGFDTYDDTGGYHVSGAQVGGGLEAIVPEVVEWLEGQLRTKFFVFVHTYDVHCPYTPPEPFFSMFTEAYKPNFDIEGKCGHAYFNDRGLDAKGFEYVSALYDGGVRHTDTMLAEFLQAIKRLGLEDNTVIVVTSDHGESLGERDVIGHNQVYDVHLKVPLIVHLPGDLHRDVVQPVQSIDILPTVMSLLRLPPRAGLPGENLNPLMMDPVPGQRRLRYADNSDASEGTLRIDTRWSLLFKDGLAEGLYDLRDDPTEEKDLRASRPDVLAHMRAAYEHLKVPGTPAPKYPENLSQEKVEQLKALGYTF